ncbi:hypothetical protein MF672_039840 [Actinomadura sp. ATCC 31491]|uniref:Uncharacterized protein n=1 Tax=Actinomadura luzonensis TaxID=2805427 RepID=A0ABT0G5N8_9ACTN|nr:hypothetical protein [Actinomadura luzonensis]MCK2219906.1 hypothetical protein [Actinomadura luzonensis]
MITVVRSGPFWCALAVGKNDSVDDGLLVALAARTGTALTGIGQGGFGGGPVADVYADESRDIVLIEATDPDTGSKALLVRADSEERAIAARAVIGERYRVRTEQELRAQAREDLGGQSWILVPLVMAAGGAELEPGTAELLREALRHEDEDVRAAAEYAEEVARELRHDPMVVAAAQEEQELAEVLRPALPVEGEEDWVTVRPGVPGRAIPRPVSWWRVPAGVTDPIPAFTCDQDWLIEVVSRDDEPWREDIWTAEDGRTAIHAVSHAELAGRHVAVHGQDVETVTTALREAGLLALDGPPAGLDRTAP